MEERLLALLDKYDLRESAVSDWQVLIQSFSADSLKLIHQLDERLPLIFLGNASIANLPAVAEYAVGQGPSSGGVTQAFVTAAHALCLSIHPYTVNDVATMQRLLGYGVDGMFTTSRSAWTRCCRCAGTSVTARRPRPPTTAPATRGSSATRSAAPCRRRCR
jgi:glycerophosphoryl diester phosphodiesterase